MDILLSIVGGIVVVLGPFFGWQFFKRAESGFEQVFYLLISAISLVAGFLLFLAFWPIGAITLVITFLIVYIFFIDRDPKIEIEPELQSNLEEIINEIKKTS